MSKPSPIISVIIPVYNAEKYLEECLESILSQTIKNIEIICVDDGSTDKSPEILQQYAKVDSRLKVITQENINAGAARNHGLKHAVGKYLLFLDADDFFESNMFELMLNKAEKYKSEIIVVNSNLYLDNAKKFVDSRPFLIDQIPRRRTFSGHQVKGLFSTFVGWPWDKMFLADFIKKHKIKFQEQKSTNDLLFVYSALAQANRISVIEDVLAHHRRAVSSSISVNREKSYICSRDALIALKRQLQTWGIYETYKKDYLNYAIEHTLWQLDTLKYPIQKEFFLAFRDKWAKEYGLTKKLPKELFYNHDHYQRLQTILNGNYEQNLLCRAQIDEYWLEDAIKNIKELSEKNNILNRELNNERNNLQEIKNSRTYRIANSVTSSLQLLRKNHKK